MIGRKNFYGSGAGWAARLAADVWTVTATAARHGIEPLGLLTSYLHECARNGGAAPAGAWRPATSVDSDHTRITGHRRNPDGDEVPEVRRRL